MNYSYSATTNSFYDNDLYQAYVDAGNWPDDATGVEDCVFAEYRSPPPNGKVRGSDGDGMPTWVDAPEPTEEQILMMAQSEVRSRSDVAMASMRPLQFADDIGIATADEMALLAGWKAYVVALYRLPASTGWPSDIEWPISPA